MLNLYLLINLRTTGLVAVLLLFAWSVLNAQDDTSYSFMVAGHAYGSHDGENTGLHPPLLDRLYSGFDAHAEFIIFTGDIVNQSTVESWLQVERELDSISLSAYYVMGNHDNNEAGRAVFQDKFGGTYYSFYAHQDLFVVLNSIEADRAISDQQLVFLQAQIDQAGDSTMNIFIFFHEILWNSHEKYTGVRSNSRSRYGQIVEHSNYWQELHPMLMKSPDKNFYLIAGDVGGNPDAIAAFYDQWDHITLLASGMGEVLDENYLLVQVYKSDSLGFKLIPLQAELSIPGIEFYSVPAAPEAISGPGMVFRGSRSVEYSVPGVFNAESYLWELPPGASGSSSSDRIEVDFDETFETGEISVRASRDGFGTSIATSRMIQADYTSVESINGENPPPMIRIHVDRGMLFIECEQSNAEQINIRILDSSGRVLETEQIAPGNPGQELQVSLRNFPKGLLIVSAFTRTRHFSEKIVTR